MKLAVAMAKMIASGNKVAQRQLKEICDLEQNKLASIGRNLKGRQYVRLLVDNFATIDGSEQMYGLDHLLKVEFKGSCSPLGYNSIKSALPSKEEISMTNSRETLSIGRFDIVTKSETKFASTSVL